jgi:hypothetical protein
VEEEQVRLAQLEPKGLPVLSGRQDPLVGPDLSAERAPSARRGPPAALPEPKARRELSAPLGRSVPPEQPEPVSPDLRGQPELRAPLLPARSAPRGLKDQRARREALELQAPLGPLGQPAPLEILVPLARPVLWAPQARWGLPVRWVRPGLRAQQAPQLLERLERPEAKARRELLVLREIPAARGRQDPSERPGPLALPERWGQPGLR